MASATTEKPENEKAMASDVVASGADDDGGEKHRPPQTQRDQGDGFFHIYKKGQGYWTRMGTAGAAALLAALTASFLYQHLHVWLHDMGVSLGHPSRFRS